MDDGHRKRTAEFNWSDNKPAWTLTNEYRRVSNQAILVFDLKLAREMQPLNAPGLMDEMEWDLTRGELSDPYQLGAAAKRPAHRRTHPAHRPQSCRSVVEEDLRGRIGAVARPSGRASVGEADGRSVAHTGILNNKSPRMRAT